MPDYGDNELETIASYVIFKINRLSFWFSQLTRDGRFISADHEIYFLKNQLFTSLLNEKHPPSQITFTLYNKLADNKNSHPPSSRFLA